MVIYLVPHIQGTECYSDAACKEENLTWAEENLWKLYSEQLKGLEELNREVADEQKL